MSRAGRALRQSRARQLGSASRFFLLASVLAGIPTVCAYAQSEVVTVTAEKQSATTSIDRKTYRVSSDLSATAGSINDVLRNIPSVEIDIDGNVSLRGDTNVLVLIDGKPSTMLSATNRADVLSQMPANSIDSIEVMTNPSAQYKPDGSSGIINIITKKTQKPGFSGTLQSNYGTEGRYNLGASAAYAAGGLSVTGNITFRHDIRKRTGTDARTRIDSSGNTASNQDLLNAQPRHAFVASLSAKYKFDPKNQINA
ncbi:MAG TPA: TonB-dependent receptor plug domain-containing protein, partial [Rhizomicrobium sp.]|nr:TonB-dependent receptor plug domain-containing protein [Rhizomicrobium sp.]